MKTASIYSLLSLRLVPGTGEKLLLGLLMSDEGGVRFDFSRKRMDLAAKLLNPGDYHLVKALLISLKNELNGNEASGLFVPQTQDWSEAYLNYLSRYSTNLVSFDAPKKLELPFGAETFNKMFARFFGSLPEVKTPAKRTFEKRVKTFIHEALKERANIEVELRPKELKGLLFPVTLSSLGKNELPFVCDTIDFCKRHDSVEKRLGAFLHLRNGLNAEYSSSSIFIIGNEPAKSMHENHSIWKNVHGSGLFKLVPEKEKEQVAEYAAEHDVKPWFETE